MEARRTGRTTQQLERSIEAARAGYVVFFFSSDEALTMANLYKARALLDKSPLGYELIPSKKQLRLGAGAIRFRTLARERVTQRLLRPSIAPELNRDPAFADATRGLKLVSVVVDHHAEYLLDRDERRAREPRTPYRSNDGRSVFNRRDGEEA